MIWARIENDVVSELFSGESVSGLFHPSIVWVECGPEVAVGWTYDGEFRPPVVEPTQVTVVTMRQARLALHQASLLDAVEQAVAVSDTPVQIEWEFAHEIRRDWPTLTALASVLGLSDLEVDQLFALAATL